MLRKNVEHLQEENVELRQRNIEHPNKIEHSKQKA